ncbi:hypothetical protein M2139_001522 [Enterococcus sp. PF1-24]|uniref:hypothetical protein n=1 Tax=unclassified Enterococcus TaxID=2608891 RepID=UPI002474C8A2|nr:MULTISPECIES: hypothetical protein [unclassified Enterococcus]MDH6364487.1 hypothetical protein [Enterococcus sp. PFB1-1]MDH6401636.1 hypothetical protein [Enterococcus sp. PF1-24]
MANKITFQKEFKKEAFQENAKRVQLFDGSVCWRNKDKRWVSFVTKDTFILNRIYDEIHLVFNAGGKVIAKRKAPGMSLLCCQEENNSKGKEKFKIRNKNQPFEDEKQTIVYL